MALSRKSFQQQEELRCQNGGKVSQDQNHQYRSIKKKFKNLQFVTQSDTSQFLISAWLHLYSQSQWETRLQGTEVHVEGYRGQSANMAFPENTK